MSLEKKKDKVVDGIEILNCSQEVKFPPVKGFPRRELSFPEGEGCSQGAKILILWRKRRGKAAVCNQKSCKSRTRLPPKHPESLFWHGFE